MAKPQLSLKRRLLRLLLWLAGVALAFITYGALLGAQTNFYFMAHYTAHQVPEVNVVPQPLLDSTASQAPGTALSYYGDTFEVPWQGMATLKPAGKLKPVPNITNVKFASGQVLMIWAPTGSRGFLQDVAEDKTMGSAQMRALFASDIKGGPYQEESALLNATSDQVKFFDPPWVSARRFFLLFFKSIAEGPEIKTGIYAFHTPVVRGFEIGNPAYSPHVRLDFFDMNGNSLGEVISAYGKQTSYRGTQADLNRIIQTFHPLANSSTTAPVSASAALKTTK
jgi:hypothetical protein